MSKIKAFIAGVVANPIVRKAAVAFALSAVPLVVAAYNADGVHGVTAAVVLAAVIAGVHAAASAIGITYTKLVG